MAILVGYFFAMAAYFLCYYPVVTQIRGSKDNNQLMVSYKMLCFGRYKVREERLENVSDIVVLPIKSQYGIIGYVADIYFKNGAPKIQIYKDRGDDVVNDYEELSFFILGRNATDNMLSNDCDCTCGGCYCVCCDYWGIVIYFFVLAVLVYVGISFGIGYIIDKKFLELSK